MDAGCAVLAGELLAEPADDEQRVVDGQPEPDQRDDVDREDRDVGEHRDESDDRQRTEDGNRTDEPWHECRDQAAEDKQAQHEHDRHRDRLGAGDVGRHGLTDVVEDRPLATDVLVKTVGIQVVLDRGKVVGLLILGESGERDDDHRRVAVFADQVGWCLVGVVRHSPRDGVVGQAVDNLLHRLHERRVVCLHVIA